MTTYNHSASHNTNSLITFSKSTTNSHNRGAFYFKANLCKKYQKYTDMHCYVDIIQNENITEVNFTFSEVFRAKRYIVHKQKSKRTETINMLYYRPKDRGDNDFQVMMDYLSTNEIYSTGLEVIEEITTNTSLIIKTIIDPNLYRNATLLKS